MGDLIMIHGGDQERAVCEQSIQARKEPKDHEMMAEVTVVPTFRFMSDPVLRFRCARARLASAMLPRGLIRRYVAERSFHRSTKVRKD